MKDNILRICRHPRNNCEETLWTRDYVLILASTISVYLAFHSLNPTLPLYIKQMGGNKGLAGAALGFLNIAAVLIRPIAGRVLDSGRRKAILVTGILLFLIPSVAYPWVSSVVVLLSWRFLQGFGWGIASTTASTVAADLIPKTRLGEGMGFFSLASTVSLAAAPALSLWAIGWSGFPLLFAGGIAVTVLSFATALPLRGPEIEPRHGKPSPSLLESTALMPAAIVLCVTATYSSLLSFVSLYAREEGLPGAGAFFTTFAITTLVTRPLSGRLTDRKGSDIAIIPGLLFLTTAMIILACAGSLFELIVSGACYGIGFGAVLPALITLCLRNVPPGRRGAATGTYWTAFDVGIALGSLLWGHLTDTLGFRPMFLLNALTAALTLVLYLELRRRLRVVIVTTSS